MAKNELVRKVDQIRDLMKTPELMGKLYEGLPRHLSPDRMTSLVLGCLRKNPKLLSCTQTSLFSAIAQASTLGLEMDGTLGQAYLVPYGSECTLIVGYKGLLSLMRRSGEVSTITLEVVLEGDQFEYQLGDEPYIRHVPSEDPDRESKTITHAYCVVTLKDSGKQRSVWGRAKLDAHMKMYSPSHTKSDSPWRTSFGTMCKKTVVRDMVNRGLVPVSAELQRLAMREEISEQSHIEGTVINSNGAGNKMELATAALKSMMIPQEEEEVEEEVVVTVAPDTSMSLADQAQAVVKAVPTIEGFWNVALRKRNASTLRDHYDMMAGDPELTEDERDGLLTLRKIREAQLSGGGQKTLI
jgi:phage RecT family recombinase